MAQHLDHFFKLVLFQVVALDKLMVRSELSHLKHLLFQTLATQKKSAYFSPIEAL
jgi:hypothetical protein